MKKAKSPIELPGVVTASRDVPGGYRINIELEAEREHVPGILLVPDRSTCPDNRCAAALLLHGVTSRKERMAEGIGRALLAYNIATLSIDLPMHGARNGSAEQFSLRNPLQLIGAWRLALSEVRHSLDYLSNLASVDTQRLALVGYSLGAYLAIVAAADDARVTRRFLWPLVSEPTCQGLPRSSSKRRTQLSVRTRPRVDLPRLRAN